MVMDKSLKRKIRVAHFIGSLHIGGAENQVSLLVSAMDPAEFDRHVIVMHDDDQGFKDVLDPQVSYFSIGYRNRNAPVALYRLYRYLVKNQIDILHCHMYHATVKGALIGRMASVPVIVTSEHGKNAWKRWRHHVMEKYIVNPLVAKRVAVSEDIRQIRIREDGVAPKGIMVFPNAVDTNVPVKKTSAEVRVIGALGRLVDAKDYPVLIQAIGRLVSEGRDIRLQIAGEGEEREVLERQINDLGLSGVVDLVGIQPANEFMSAIDVFAMSSKREGVPVALLEAMARGLPIAATAVGGIPEIINDTVEGLLCEAGNPAALAANIATIIDDVALRQRIGSQARQKVIERYSVDTVVGAWSRLYSMLLTAKE